jgi:hypothetical protein
MSPQRLTGRKVERTFPASLPNLRREIVHTHYQATIAIGPTLRTVERKSSNSQPCLKRPKTSVMSHQPRMELPLRSQRFQSPILALDQGIVLEKMIAGDGSLGRWEATKMLQHPRASQQPNSRHRRTPAQRRSSLRGSLNLKRVKTWRLPMSLIRFRRRALHGVRWTTRKAQFPSPHHLSRSLAIDSRLFRLLLIVAYPWPSRKVSCVRKRHLFIPVLPRVLTQPWLRPILRINPLLLSLL